MNSSKDSLHLIGRHYAISDVKPLSPQTFNNLVKRRALKVLDEGFDGNRLDGNEDARRAAEVEIRQFYEKIHAGNNLLPVGFLYEGAQRARAVCRIVTSSSYGTGFLVGRGFLMTNNHVVETIDEARTSFAEFDYEEGKERISVALRPDRLFVTQEDLDFSIIGCDTSGIEDIAPIPLLRNPATITRSEPVNIIQHPHGRPKEIAIQDNDVLYVYDKVLRYRTDTEPGSSGSSVFNNQWELVALHHAGWYEKASSTNAINEGIRISAIVNRLLKLSRSNNEQRESAGRALASVSDTSPYLGFFDVYGLLDSDADLREVELPAYAGTKQFADIGFWNIEHFNNRVDDKRLNDVAEVLAGLSMDVMGLVEVEAAALERLKPALRNRGQNMDFVYLDAEGSQDLAILYDVETADVRVRSDINRKYASILAMRTASGKSAFPAGREPLFADCLVKEEGKDIEFLMIVVHLKAFGDEQSRERRRMAANILSAIIEELQELERKPVILGGDFNQQLDGNVLADLTTAPDLFTLTADDAAGDAISYIGARYRSLIDHIIVSKDTQLGMIADDDAAIIRLDRSLRGFARDISDHVPIVTRLIYRESPLNSSPAVGATCPCDCNPGTSDADLRDKALVKLKIKDKSDEPDKNYYDAELDAAAVAEYYAGIAMETDDGQALFRALSSLLAASHRNQLSYKTARLTHLYPWVDLQPDGNLKSVYDGAAMDPAEVIRREYELERRREEAIRRLLNEEAWLSDDARRAALEAIEADTMFNCEHVVPQSWFSKANPMKSDLHHLFSCEPRCNSSRSNYPYFDFSDYRPEHEDFEAVRDDCGKYENRRFEPEAGKGLVARATLYFLLRYPRQIDDYDTTGLNLLLSWHRRFPISLYEQHRNQAIFTVQGNRNPLIDFPDLAGGIAFQLGLA